MFSKHDRRKMDISSSNNNISSSSNNNNISSSNNTTEVLAGQTSWVEDEALGVILTQTL